ncbi:MAG TPA: hypothetical protein DCP03_05215, partial [Polaromonas sp.]|nr:hypothetical protein [Polaromonas sp.]
MRDQQNQRQYLQPPHRLTLHHTQPGTKGKRPCHAGSMGATSYKNNSYLKQREAIAPRVTGTLQQGRQGEHRRHHAVDHLLPLFHDGSVAGRD